MARGREGVIKSSAVAISNVRNLRPVDAIGRTRPPAVLNSRLEIKSLPIFIVNLSIFVVKLTKTTAASASH
jgi:hypothetical protein